MSGQPSSSMPPQLPPPSSMPPQPQQFRFWLPYRSNVASSRQQPRPPSRSMPTYPRPQPPPPPPPTPAGPAPRAFPARGVEEDIPIQADSSDESDTIPVQALDSLQLRGARPSMADLELTLSRSPPTGQEQSSSRDDNRGNDTKISISGFPRSRLFDGARAPYRREIEDSLKSLAGREMPAPARSDSGQGYRVITLAGHNVGASMVLGSGSRDPLLPRAAEPDAPAVASNVNSNVQSVNNSAMEASTCNAGDPGVHVDIKNAHEEPVVVPPRQVEKPKEPVRRPPLAVPPQEDKTEAASGDAGATARPARTRRCLRALMMESDTEATPKPRPRPSACRFQCVTDHAPAATASNGGGSGMNAEEGGK